jgi:putative nucleotidyltransferase with HDIG domain
MICDPAVNVHWLCRILSDDVALAGRILSVSRSPFYGKRNLPTTLTEAVQALGLRVLHDVVIAHALQSCFELKNHKISQTLWSHSLAAALAARILCRRKQSRDAEVGFLAGLMHDIGQMIFIHGDPSGFEDFCSEAQRTQRPFVEEEQQVYGFDHMLIGITLLDSWNIDPRIGRAVLNHHNESIDDNTELSEILLLADYLCHKGSLGFIVEPSPPSRDLLVKYGCDNEESIEVIIQEIREAYAEENSLFKPA